MATFYLSFKKLGINGLIYFSIYDVVKIVSGYFWPALYIER